MNIIWLFALIVIEWGISFVLIARSWRKMTTVENVLVGQIEKALNRIETSKTKPPPYFHV